MMMPPTTLMKVISRAATASPRTNFEAPSMAPKKEDSSSRAARRAFAAFSSIRPADRSASIAICLPGIASRVKRAATSAIRLRALRDDHEIHDDQDREHDDPDDEVAPHHEVAEGLDDVAGRRRTLVAVAEDEARRGEVQGEPQHRGDEQQRREDGEFQRIIDRQAGHHDQDRHDDRHGQQQVEQDRRQREDEDRQDPQHAGGKEEVRPLRQRLEVAARRQRQLAEDGRRPCLCRRARRLCHRCHPLPLTRDATGTYPARSADRMVSAALRCGRR